MRTTRSVVTGAALLTLLAALAVGQHLLERTAMAREQGASETPVFQVDPLWPKPLPNQWVMGSVIGVSVDSQDRIWMLHRPSSLSDNEKAAVLDPPLAPCCFPAASDSRL